MITDHLDFLYSECKEMVSYEKRIDLKNMYTLLKPIPEGLKQLIQAFLDHIKNEGIETVSTLKGENVVSINFQCWNGNMIIIFFRFTFNLSRICYKYTRNTSYWL